ncbi:MAG: hypothetical protein IJ728_09790 [Selenomonadaceae bacterium]|nr:hypothetical protein [Selenomonadaceae bacterium]
MNKSLYKTFQECTNEEELKSRFIKFFKLTLNTKNKIDLYTPQITFEFKFDDHLKNLSTRARVIAQALYYVRKLKYGKVAEVPSKYICGIDKNSAVIFETVSLKNYYLKSNRKNYDWDLAPSNPCKKLVADLENDPLIQNVHVYDLSNVEDENNFVDRLKYLLNEQIQLIEVKKEINEDNFFEIFQYWRSLFENYVENGRKCSEYFITDIENGRSTLLDKTVIFRMSNGDLIEKTIPIDDYKYFWSVYEKIYNSKTVIAIRQKMDRMSEIELRRFTGEFFTPIDFARKALDYLERTIGSNWYKSKNFRLWDMAAGTGNLEFVLPAEALQYCYISTLLDDDAKYCKKIFPEATVFQYDYLNDDVEFLNNELLSKMYTKRKMPKNLIEDLKNPNLKWIIFFNPPYATASNFERSDNRKDKNNVSMTAIRELMNNDNLGEVSRELYSQFLYRINLEFKDRQAWLGMFSTLKYMNSNNDQKMRDKIFDYEFERGFVFSSQNFQGCKGKFPVGFLIWNLLNHSSLSKQEINLDVYNSTLEKIAVKKIQSINRKNFLNKWIDRPACNIKFPPLSSALNVAYQNKDRRDRISENFLASLMCSANDFQHQLYTSLLSAPYVSAGAMSITPNNFEECLIIHTVRRLPKATWLNDRDQFMQPTKPLSREFITDSVIWSLFSNSNNTAAISNVEYEGNIYQIKNNFFPFTLEFIDCFHCDDVEIRNQIYLAVRRNDDRFVAKWLVENHNSFSVEALGVLTVARRIYKVFYEHVGRLNKQKYKISTWDAGWYQIRMSLNEAGYMDGRNGLTENLQITMKRLSDKLLPQIYDLGFLQDEVIYF